MSGEARTRHVLVVGSLNADLVMRAPRLPRLGETVIGGRFHLVPGGKGANQAVAAARAGAPATMIGRVGDDMFGRLVRGAVAAAGVCVDAVAVDTQVATGAAQVIVDQSGQNAIVVASGANARLAPDDVAAAAAAWDGATLAVLQLEIPLVTVAASIALATQRRIPVLLNAAPAQQLSAALWQAVDWLVVNEIEAEQLTGRSVSSVDDAIAAGVALRCGPQHVVITMGASGAVFLSCAQPEHVPAPAIEVVDTTAAGDAFVGALAAALWRGTRPVDAVREAVAAGAVACTKVGAIPSLPTAAEIGHMRRSVL